MKRQKTKEQYRVRTHLIHGNYESKKWDYDHHVVPPISHSTAFRLTSVHRGAQGFVQFASADEALSGHMPIYIYDRLDEPSRGMLEQNLAVAEHEHVVIVIGNAVDGLVGERSGGVEIGGGEIPVQAWQIANDRLDIRI